jgi:hypothetical protein
MATGDPKKADGAFESSAFEALEKDFQDVRVPCFPSRAHTATPCGRAVQRPDPQRAHCRCQGRRVGADGCPTARARASGEGGASVVEARSSHSHPRRGGTGLGGARGRRVARAVQARVREAAPVRAPRVFLRRGFTELRLGEVAARCCIAVQRRRTTRRTPAHPARSAPRPIRTPPNPHPARSHAVRERLLRPAVR